MVTANEGELRWGWWSPGSRLWTRGGGVTYQRVPYDALPPLPKRVGREFEWLPASRKPTDPLGVMDTDDAMSVEDIDGQLDRLAAEAIHLMTRSIPVRFRQIRRDDVECRIDEIDRGVPGPALSPGVVLQGERFRRTEGGMLGWYRSVEAMYLTFWCQCSQDGWDSYAGSKLTVEFQWSQDPRPGAGRWRERIGPLSSDEEREEVRSVQNRVIAALPTPPSDHVLLTDPRLRSYYQTKFARIAEPYPASEDIWFRYHSEGDVERWADFVAERLPKLLRAFEARARERQSAGH